jgi:hypothetical protein
MVDLRLIVQVKKRPPNRVRSKGLPEFGEGVVVIDPPHALFDLQQTEGNPALPLIGVHPTVDFAEVSAQQAVDVLDRVGRLEGVP